MRKRKMLLCILVVTVLCCSAMLVVDGLWKPGYLIKSMIKVCLFLLLPLLSARLFPELSLGTLFRPRKAGLLQALGLGVGVYVLIVGGYFILRQFIDFSSVVQNLAGVTRENFLMVSIYISFCNSLLEEFFFRAFCFWGLRRCAGRRFAHGFSAVAFSLYHTTMMLRWFDWWLFGLALVGLAVGGLLFNWLNQRQEAIYPSWLVHMFANFGINTVGFLLM